jgi:hypothetical protein
MEIIGSGRTFHNVKQPVGNFLCLKSENGVDSRTIVAQINKAGSRWACSWGDRR